MFWIIAIVIVMCVMLAVYMPLNRQSKIDTTKAALMRTLAAELNEVNADKNMRFANIGEIEAARTEIGRRMLALEAAQTPNAVVHHSQWFALFALVPILAVPLYLQIGQPEYADQRFAMRVDTNIQDGQLEVAQLIKRVEARLQQKPEDSQGWAVIAPVYFRMGRVDDSLNAFAKAVEFYKGPPEQKSRLVADHAEVMVAKLGGKVSSEAKARFASALTLDQANQKAMFYLAIHLEQTGEIEAAKNNWQALISRFKSDNPAWLQVAEQRLAGLNAPVSSGPDAEQVEAASEMTPEQQQDMIKGMVEGLAAKLKDNPQDQNGWMKLIRARMVMKDKPQAELDLATARSLFAPGTQGRTEIDAVAQSVGL